MKITKKEVYRIYGKKNAILLGQYIQNYLTKIGYAERKEGWAADIFELPEPYNNIVICTGYAPFGIKSKVCKRWNELYYNYNFKQKERMIKRFAHELSKALANK